MTDICDEGCHVLSKLAQFLEFSPFREMF